MNDKYEWYTHHFDPFLPPDEVLPTAQHQLERCPIVHSDVGDFWVLNRYDDVVRLLRDPATFESGMPGVIVPHDPPGLNRPAHMPPITSNPPIHRDFRLMLNPYFATTTVLDHAPAIRTIVSELLDRVLVGGQCDFARQFTKVFPARTTFEILFGIEDSEELTMVLHWVSRLHFKYLEPAEDMVPLQRAWDAWVDKFIEDRRRGPRRKDMIDALLHETVEDGRQLTHDEINGAIQGIIGGGFNTTSDAACNIVVALIEQPGLEARMRDQPSEIPAMIEEVLRLDPPISTRPRRCTVNTEFGGHSLEPGDRLLANFLAANVDPAEFNRPTEFDIERGKNRHLSFGAGRHRCIGAPFARISLQIVVEELLSRVRDLAFAQPSGEHRISFGPNSWRRVESLEITFTELGQRTALAR